MKKTTAILFLLFFTSYFSFAEKDSSLQLNGNVEISIEEGYISFEFSITGFKEFNNKNITFSLNDIFNIESLLINGNKGDFKKSDLPCSDCHYYILPIVDNTIQELKIKAKGTFDKENNSKREDYKGLISYKNEILRASEQAKWYPIIIEDVNIPSYAQKQFYTYQLNVKCDDCKNVFVGSEEPQGQQGIFTENIPQDAILLIAGKYDFTSTPLGLYINMSKENIDILESNIQSILNYYEKISGIGISKRIVYAHLPSNNSRWGGFVTFPAIVDVNQEPKTNRLHFLSHELAHFYFGDIYQPKSNLFWFCLESFAEYYSYKYLLEHSPNLIQSDYKRLKKIRMAQMIPFFKSIKGYHFRIKKLKKIKKIQDITSIHRYSVGGFQLLGLEHEIGENKMQEFIPQFFKNLSHEKNGYRTLIQTLKEINISPEIITRVKKDYLNKLKFRKYNFVKEQFGTTNK